MLSQFFEQNKLLLQSIGFSMVIAGIFLNIQTPTNDTAHNSLIIIQAIWFLSADTLLFMLLVKIFYWISRVEIKKSSDIFSAYYTLTLLFVGVITFSIFIPMYLTHSNGLSVSNNFYVLHIWSRVAVIAIFLACVLVAYNGNLNKQNSFIAETSVPIFISIFSILLFEFLFYLFNDYHSIKIGELLFQDFRLRMYLIIIHLIGAIFIQLQFHRKIQKSTIYSRLSKKIFD
jgi:hypothetical protein